MSNFIFNKLILVKNSRENSIKHQKWMMGRILELSKAFRMLRKSCYQSKWGHFRANQYENLKTC